MQQVLTFLQERQSELWQKAKESRVQVYFCDDRVIFHPFKLVIYPNLLILIDNLQGWCPEHCISNLFSRTKCVYTDGIFSFGFSRSSLFTTTFFYVLGCQVTKIQLLKFDADRLIGKIEEFCRNQANK